MLESGMLDPGSITSAPTRRKKHVLVLFLATVAVLCMGCGAPNSTDTLVYGRGGDSVNFDPAMVQDGESAKVLVHVMEGLVRFRADSMDVEPCLAKAWVISDDKRTLTFTLRENVSFHDGSEFDSDAVVFTFRRMLEKEHPYAPSGATYPPFAFQPYIELVEAVDRFTVRFLLKAPYAPILKNLAMFTGYIASPSAFERLGSDAASNPVGTGPYRFVRWQRNALVELERYEGYWGEPPKTRRVIFRSILDGAVRVLSLQKGEIHIMDGVEPQLVPKIRDSNETVLLTEPGQTVGFVGFDVTVSPFDDVRVRRALNHAVNRDQICRYLFQELAVPAKGVLPEGVLGYAPEKLPEYPYDPEEAKRLLTEAGYPQGFEAVLTTYTVPRPYNPMGSRLAEQIQADLGQAGVRVTIETLEWGRYLDAVRDFQAPFALRGWSGDNGDPDNFLWTRLGEPNNASRYMNPRFIDLLQRGVETFDDAERTKLYEEAERIAVEDAPWVFLNHSMDMAACRKEVIGFRIHPSGTHRLWDVYLEPHPVAISE